MGLVVFVFLLGLLMIFPFALRLRVSLTVESFLTVVALLCTCNETTWRGRGIHCGFNSTVLELPTR